MLETAVIMVWGISNLILQTIIMVWTSSKQRRDEKVTNIRSSQTPPEPLSVQTNSLRTFYDIVIDPIADLIQGNEVILIPEGPLCLALMPHLWTPTPGFYVRFVESEWFRLSPV